LQYSDEDAAALYDLLNPWGASDDFYLALAMEAGSVLDVGWGTGTLLRGARDAGHAGRLCGVDPDRAMLAIAQRRGDVEWMPGTAAALTFESEFELAVMTGHAFQFLVEDDELRASLAAIRRALVDGGRFAFETRKPSGTSMGELESGECDRHRRSGRPAGACVIRGRVGHRRSRRHHRDSTG